MARLALLHPSRQHRGNNIAPACSKISKDGRKNAIQRMPAINIPGIKKRKERTGVRRFVIGLSLSATSWGWRLRCALPGRFLTIGGHHPIMPRRCQRTISAATNLKMGVWSWNPPEHSFLYGPIPQRPESARVGLLKIQSIHSLTAARKSVENNRCYRHGSLRHQN